jgi:hypothetical protein
MLRDSRQRIRANIHAAAIRINESGNSFMPNFYLVSGRKFGRAVYQTETLFATNPNVAPGVF